MASLQVSTRILDPTPVPDLDAYDDGSGFAALAAARQVEPAVIIDTVAASGLRGRGGAGFPTAQKWRTVVEESVFSGVSPRVVVNGAEGEPGSYKDRLLLERNPYRVIEGALVAAHAVGATEIVLAVKSTFGRAIDRIETAIAEVAMAGLLGAVTLEVRTGPSQYLFGEETALLEVLAGRPPFPRVAPPYLPAAQPAGSEEGTADWVAERPVLVNNTETLANIPGIVTNGPDWFRAVGTEDSPGTVLCTITGRTKRHGVAEVPMGTTLSDAIQTIGGGALDGHRLIGAISGVSNAVVPLAAFDTPLTHEAMRGISAGLGAAGFIVLDDGTDLVETTRSVSRFLAVESCGQCEACKSDGLAISELLDDVPPATVATRVEEQWFADMDVHLARITDGARCSLAQQHQVVVRSLLELADLRSRAADAPADPPAAALDDRVAVPFLPLISIEGGQATLDLAEAERNPDWSIGGPDSGSWPAARLATTDDLA